MSETEGLQKLTEYLKQTRRQAETAIDNLNGQVVVLKNENSELRLIVEKLQKDKFENEKLIEKLREENSNKWKFKERDEWKALVENIQRDRDRLQTEYNAVVAHLNDANEEICRLRDDLNVLSHEKQILENQLQSSQKAESNLLDCGDGRSSPVGEFKDLILQSPIVDRNGDRLIFDDSIATPKSIALQLKLELRRAHEQVKNVIDFDYPLKRSLS
jgi:DNA repair exonuclease SbcCD ATPase subunit